MFQRQPVCYFPASAFQMHFMNQANMYVLNAIHSFLHFAFFFLTSSLLCLHTIPLYGHIIIYLIMDISINFNIMLFQSKQSGIKKFAG